MLSSLAPARRRLLLVVVGLLVVIAVALATLGVVQREQGVPAVAQDVPGPVLLVPGYGGSRAALEVLAGRLRADGRTATVLALPGNGTGDLRDVARLLERAAGDAIAGGASSVDVVGFSAGGVSARWWVAELGGAEVARRVVTLGSPHHGTEVAGIGAALAPGSCPPGCRQLAPGSDLLRTLNAEDETPDGPLWTAVWTDQDEVVTPPDSARLAGATNVVVQQVCPGTALAHGDLPRSPLVISLVQEALDVPPPPTTYGAQDCGRLSS